MLGGFPVCERGGLLPEQQKRLQVSQLFRTCTPLIRQVFAFQALSIAKLRKPAVGFAKLSHSQELILVGRRRGPASYSDLFRHPDELDKGLSLHFAHDLSAMHFDRDFTASQLARDLLIKQARHD